MKTSFSVATLALLLLALMPRVPQARPLPGPGPTFVAVAETLTVMESASRWRAADSVTTASLKLLDREPIADSLSLAWMLVRQCNYRRLLGQTRTGVPLAAAQRALAIGERLRPFDPRRQALAHSSAALVFFDLSNGDSMLAHADRGERLLRESKPVDDSLLTTLLLRKGQAYRVLLEHAAAVATLGEARERALRNLRPDAPDLGAVCEELGYNLSTLGEFDRARAEYENAVRIAEINRLRFPRRLEAAIQGMAMLERRSGNRARAVELASRAHGLYVEREGPNGPQAPVFMASLANALMALGDFPRARALLEQVVERQTVALPPAHPGLLQNRLTLASANVGLGDFRTARAQLDRVDSILVAGGSKDRSNLAYGATIRTNLDLQDGRFAEARRLLLAAAHGGPLEFGRRTDLAGLLYRTVNAPEDAAFADSLGRALDAWADTAEVERTKNWTALLVQRAGAEARLGLSAPAWEHALQAEAVARERFDQELEALTDYSALLLDEDEANPSEVLVQLARPDRPDEVRRAWDAVIARRGAIVDVVLARRALPAGSDTALVGAHARWVAASRRHARLVVSGALEDDDPAALARMESSRAAADDAERDFARVAAAHGRTADRVSLARVLAGLGPKQVLVAFVQTEPSLGEEQLSALIGRTGSEPTVVRLGAPGPIADRVRAWTELLSSPPPAGEGAARRAESAARKAGEAVRTSVWDPLAAAIAGAGEVRIVGAGPVLDLPWLVLPNRSGRYLAESGPRLRVHASERDVARQPASVGRGLLAVGDPDFDRHSEPSAPRSTFALRGLPGGCATGEEQLGSLPGARAETHAVVERWGRSATGEPADELVGAEATEERFKRLASGRRIIHIATHGVLTRDSCSIAANGARGVGGIARVGSGAAPPKQPAGSAKVASPSAPAFEPPPSPWLGRETWLAFAGANRAAEAAGDENEGWLTAEEVVTLDLRGTERVALSACQSGVVDRWSREALLGMRRAFHLAGARSVLASQWAIDDESTRALMERYYESDSPSAGVALQEACRTVIAQRRARGLTTHPFTWGAFTVTGD